jgi:nitroimidazol reductase NimA-like FMN-containing flavoprotein (pyridoxamine 5'-phosphate oxidase superfamily)
MKTMRRKDREKPREFALAVTDKCAYAVMATVNPDGSPYCIPLSITREDEWLYFHCAQEGQKIDNLRHQNKVCVTCVGNVRVIPKAFGLEYESAVINGTAEEIIDKEEKIRALAIISRRYTPDDMDGFNEAIERSIDRTAVWKIHIDGIFGKGRTE